MTHDAAERLRRLLSVIPLFADTECITRDELEKRSGVDTTVLLEDFRVVTERLDTPGGFVEGLRIEIEADRISLHSSNFQRPTRITIPELCALELGLAMLRSSTSPDDVAPIMQARTKLRSAIVEMPAPHDDSWQAPGPASPSDAIVESMGRAARSWNKVRIEYQAAKESQPTSRVIHPYHVIFARGAWYVAGHCERSNGLRFFRADRMATIAIMEDSFVRPDNIAIDELIPGGKAFYGSPEEVLVVRYSPRVARWIAEREGKEPDADGRLTIQHGLADDEWAVRHVLQYGPEAEVLSPLRIRAKVRGALRAMIG